MRYRPDLPGNPEHPLVGGREPGPKDTVYRRHPKGYVYAAGCHVETINGGEKVRTETTADGTRRQWLVSAAGVYSPVVDAADAAMEAMPAKHRELEWGGLPRTLKGSQAERSIRQWGESVGQAGAKLWLWVTGAPGEGKSVSATLVERDARLRGISTLKVTWVELLGRLRATFDPMTKTSEQAVLDEVYAVDLLILDDVDKDGATAYEARTLFRIADAREQANRATMATSNWRLKQSMDRYGPELAAPLYRRASDGIEVILSGRRR